MDFLFMYLFPGTSYVAGEFKTLLSIVVVTFLSCFVVSRHNIISFFEQQKFSNFESQVDDGIFS